MEKTAGPAMSTAGTSAAPPLAYARGCLLVLMAGAWLSLGGLIVRLIAQADDWQIVFFRSLSAAVGFFLLLALRDRGNTLRTFRLAGLPGLIAGAAMAVPMITFILAVNATSVANALFLLAVAPFLAAMFGWLLLREAIGRPTWLAMAAALCGITIMVWNGFTVGTLFGNVMGLLAALGFAVFAVALRFGRATDMLPAVVFACVFSMAAAAAVIAGGDGGFAIPWADFALCVLYGAIMAGALAVYTVGSRAVPSAELTLLSLTEVLLGPVWVWLILNEVPEPLTLVGGGVLMAAIVGLAIVNIARR
jgi:drug/metabolite transporter (DMT)-like permease